MLTEKRLLQLGFRKRKIHDGIVYCYKKYCLKFDVTGLVPTNIESNQPMAWTSALDSEVDLRRYYLEYCQIHLPQ